MTTRDKIQSYLEQADTDALLLEPDTFDVAILGIAERCGCDPVVAYDRALCIDALMANHGWDREEAEEYFEFNTLGTWVGEQTPIFIDTRFAE